MKQITTRKGVSDAHYNRMDIFFQGVADCYLAAQNLTNAIESNGLGAVFLGSILNDPQKIIDILDLPELTFPMVGMLFGYPDDNPQLKPRMDKHIKIGTDYYPHSDNILDELSEYDQEMTHYYDTRQKNKRSDTFTDQVVRKLTSENLTRQQLLQVVSSQGFDLMV